MAKDQEYNRLIHKNRWLKLRKWKLSVNPVCERCNEKPATEIHHIKPVEDAIGRERYNLMYDPHNLKALCHDCHVLTHTELGRSGKQHAKRKAAEQLKDFCKKFLIFEIMLKVLTRGGVF